MAMSGGGAAAAAGGDDGPVTEYHLDLDETVITKRRNLSRFAPGRLDLKAALKINDSSRFLIDKFFVGQFMSEYLDARARGQNVMLIINTDGFYSRAQIHSIIDRLPNLSHAQKQQLKTPEFLGVSTRYTRARDYLQRFVDDPYEHNFDLSFELELARQGTLREFVSKFKKLTSDAEKFDFLLGRRFYRYMQKASLEIDKALRIDERVSRKRICYLIDDNTEHKSVPFINGRGRLRMRFSRFTFFHANPDSQNAGHWKDAFHALHQSEPTAHRLYMSCFFQGGHIRAHLAGIIEGYANRIAENHPLPMLLPFFSMFNCAVDEYQRDDPRHTMLAAVHRLRGDGEFNLFGFLGALEHCYEYYNTNPIAWKPEAMAEITQQLDEELSELAGHWKAEYKVDLLKNKYWRKSEIRVEGTTAPSA